MVSQHWLKYRRGMREREYLGRVCILSHYSNPIGIPICNNCGEQDMEVLCLDHIRGGGRKQLRETHSKGTSFYRWLINHNFPEGYQVLCANCNMRKGRHEQVETRSKHQPRMDMWRQRELTNKKS